MKGIPLSYQNLYLSSNSKLLCQVIKEPMEIRYVYIVETNIYLYLSEIY